MSIASSDILLLLTGGAGNTDPNASLGGANSSTQVVDNVKNNMLDDVTPAEATAGDVEYRGFAYKNNHGTLALQDARIFIPTATSSPDDEVDIAVAAEAVNVQMATIANESTVPTGVVFSRPSTYAAGLQLNSATGLPAGGYRGFWLRRTVNASAAPTSVSFAVRCEGQTA